MLVFDGVQHGNRLEVVAPRSVRFVRREEATIMPNRQGVFDGIFKPQSARPTTLSLNPDPATTDASFKAPSIGWALAGSLALTLASVATVKSVALPHASLSRQLQQHTTRIDQTAHRPPSAVTSISAPAESRALQQLATDFVAGQPTTYGIYIKDLKTGAVAGINPDQQFEAASLYKLFVAQTVLKLADTGKLSLNSPSDDGFGHNLRDCLNLMVTVSDNGCGQAMGSLIGWGKQDQTLNNFGYSNTSLDSATPSTSARDVGLLYDRLYGGTLLSPLASGEFLTLLKNQQINNRLPAGLPEGTMIAHKTGDLDNFVHDAGIVYSPKTDYIVVMTSGPWSSVLDAPARFADFSARLYHQLNQ